RRYVFCLLRAGPYYFAGRHYHGLRRVDLLKLPADAHLDLDRGPDFARPEVEDAAEHLKLGRVDLVADGVEVDEADVVGVLRADLADGVVAERVEPAEGETRHVGEAAVAEPA